MMEEMIGSWSCHHHREHGVGWLRVIPNIVDHFALPAAIVHRCSRPKLEPGSLEPSLRYSGDLLVRELDVGQI